MSGECDICGEHALECGCKMIIDCISDLHGHYPKTYTEWCSLFSFLKEKKPEYLKYLYNPPPKKGKDHPLSNFSYEADMYLWENCPLQFVKNNLRRQYGKTITKNISDDFYEVMNKVPTKELNKLSKDASKNLDDHLYEK